MGGGEEKNVPQDLQREAFHCWEMADLISPGLCHYLDRLALKLQIPPLPGPFP